jgi:hypothetical protein
MLPFVAFAFTTIPIPLPKMKHVPIRDGRSSHGLNDCRPLLLPEETPTDSVAGGPSNGRSVSEDGVDRGASEGSCGGVIESVRVSLRQRWRQCCTEAVKAMEPLSADVLCVLRCGCQTLRMSMAIAGFGLFCS